MLGSRGTTQLRLMVHKNLVSLHPGAWREQPWATEDDLDGKGSLQHPEWQALYMQFSQEHVLGTVPYRWESHYEQAQVMEITFEDLHVVVLEGDMLHDGSITMAEKAVSAKTAAGIRDGFLLDSLGRKGSVALVRETETEWELLIPHCLLPQLKFQERVVARWQRHARMPVSSHWCDVSAGSHWLEWHDTIKPECIPDVSQSLLPNGGSSSRGFAENSPIEGMQEITGTAPELCETEVPGLWLMRDFLNKAQEINLLRLIDQCDWKMNRASTRRVQMYGVRHDDQYRIHAKSATTALPAFIDPLIQDIVHVVHDYFHDHVVYMSKLGIAKVTEVFVNEYDPDSSLQFHTDHTITYEDMIVGVSLGSDSDIRFLGKGREHVIYLPRRSIYFMTGGSRVDYKHGMLTGDCHGERRVSLTFRIVRESAIIK